MFKIYLTVIWVVFNIFSLSAKASIDSTAYYNQLYQDNLNWDWTDPNAAGTPVASGVYVYELKIGQKWLVKKMLLVR